MPLDIETRILTALTLRDAIARAPAVLAPIGAYRQVFEGHSTFISNFLEDDQAPATTRRSLQAAVGEYLAQITAPAAPAFVCERSLPPEGDARTIVFFLAGGQEQSLLDGVSVELFSRIYDAASPATFGDLASMETRVDPLVRSGRELPAGRFKVSADLCTWVEQTWAKYFQPANVRAEPYKINIYGPGDRFAPHRDTPEAGLVGTFLVALGGWGTPCDGGGLAVHDVCGCHRWDATAGWAAFHPFLTHEVEPVAAGARMTVSFKVFANGHDTIRRGHTLNEAMLAEAAELIALCRNALGQVGVLLSFAYSLNCTSLYGRDLIMYRILERLGTVESIPVAVHLAASARESYYWAADAEVYALSPENLDCVLKSDDGGKNSAKSAAPAPMSIPFIPSARGHLIYDNSKPASEWTGNYAEPANVDTLYVHRALVVTTSSAPRRGTIRWSEADLRKTDLSGMKLDDASFREADLQGCSLEAATLRDAMFVDADLRHANLEHADLAHADLSRAMLCNASLADANLRHANLDWADFSNARLDRADFTHANIEGVYFHEVSLQDVVLRGATWNQDTHWPQGLNPIVLCGTLPTDKELSVAQLTLLIEQLKAAGKPTSLELDRLERLSGEEAAVVAGCEGCLSLNGLSTLSDHAAIALSRHTGEWLSLDGVTTLSTAAADALAEYKGALDLNSLATLTSAALATKLVSQITTDQVESEKSILPYDQEEIRPWSHFGEVILPAVTELSPEAAHALVEAIHAVANEYPDLMIDSERGNGYLALDGLRSLSVEVARQLVRHGGCLGLNGVTALSAAAAEALAGIGEYTLGLSGLREMADDVAEALAKHKGDLVLRGLERWSDVARQRFTPRPDSEGVYTSNSRWGN